MDMNTMISGLTLTKTIQVSPDEDAKKAKISKQIILKVRYDGLRWMDLALKALDKDVVSWQNGSGGRKNYDNLIDKGTVEISASAPGKAPQVDSAEAEAAKLATMSDEEQQVHINKLLAMAKAKAKASK